MKFSENYDKGTRNRSLYFSGDQHLDPGIFLTIFFNHTHKQYWMCWALAEVCTLQVLLCEVLLYVSLSL